MTAQKGISRLRVSLATACVIAFAIPLVSYLRSPASIQQRSIVSLASEALPWVSADISFAISPDGNQILLKKDTGHITVDAELWDVYTNRKLATLDHGFPLLVCWSPDKSCVAFVSDEQGDQVFRLFLWWPGSQLLLRPNVPTTSLADRFMRWSPDGSTLAFRTTSGKLGDNDRLYLLDIKSLTPRLAFEGPPIGDFRWSNDGRRIAIVLVNNDGGFLIVDEAKCTSSAVSAVPGKSIIRLDWTLAADKILLSCREYSDSRYSIVEFDTESHRVQQLLSTNDEIGYVTPLGDGKLLFSGRYGEVRIHDPKNPSTRSLGLDGWTFLGAVERGNKTALIEHVGFQRPRALFRIQLESHEIDSKPLSPTTGLPFGLPPEKLQVDSPSGGVVNAYLWKSGSTDPKGLLVKFPSRRGAPVAPYDAGDQYLLAKGYAIVAFDFRVTPRKSPGDLVILDDDVKDALTVIAAISSKLNVESNNVVLFGTSNGSFFAAKAALALGHKNIGLVLKGVTTSLCKLPPVKHHNIRLAVLQGENDQYTPTLTRHAVKNLFGPDVLDAPTGHFGVLLGEGHSTRLARSRAMIAASIVSCFQSTNSIDRNR